MKANFNVFGQNINIKSTTVGFLVTQQFEEFETYTPIINLEISKKNTD